MITIVWLAKYEAVTVWVEVTLVKLYPLAIAVVKALPVSALPSMVIEATE